MLKKLEIDYFADGYTVATGGSCLDMVIAGALGSINKISYYEYLFSLSFYSNWGGLPGDWYEFRQSLIGKMGYVFCVKQLDTWEMTLECIYKYIDNNIYVLMPVTYDSLFYNLNSTDAPHFIMIVGYDKDKDILLVVDSNFVEHGLNLHRDKYTLYQVAFKTSSIKSIWEKVIELDPESYYLKQLYGIKKSISKQPNTDEWLKLLVNNVQKNSIENSQFIQAIKESQETMKYNDIGWLIIYLRDNYLGRLQAFFDYFNMLNNEVLKKEMLVVSDKLYEIRNNVISRIHLRLLRKEEITDKFLAEVSILIRKSDNDMFNTLLRFI